MKEIKLGEAMKRRRIELRLSQAEVCEGICEVITLSRLENGHQSMAYDRVKALMQRLNMPDDRYYALLSDREAELEKVKKELLACCHSFNKAKSTQKQQAWKLAMEQLHRLEVLAEDDDRITLQYVLSHRAILGKENGPYILEEQLEMLISALRLTIPKFQFEKFESFRYSIDETQIINQIAGAYLRNGEHVKALKLYEQLFHYAKKSDDQLSLYIPHFTLIAHNYARGLAIQKYYHEAVEIAEQGKQMGIRYGYYQLLPGFLYIIGECYYRLGRMEESKELCLQAHYLYKVLGDERNLRILDPDIKAWFHIDLQ